jgi:5'(3')-deoxyribonucleotidase
MSTILLDVDGVLADTHGAGARLLETIAPGAFDPRAWDFGTSKLTQEERDAFWAGFGAPGFCAGLEPYPGAIDFVEHIPHRVVFVTSPFNTSPTWMHERQEWLLHHFKNVLRGDCKNIVHANEKSHVFGHVLIDDKPSNVAKWQERWCNSVGLLYSQPYNDDTQDGAFRYVNNYAQARAWIDRGTP